jgi:hypothetical protein
MMCLNDITRPGDNKNLYPRTHDLIAALALPGSERLFV